jgi:transcriptional regulator with XRE-family HTH domain
MNTLTIGQKCANFRRLIGISQQQVADELGYTRTNISMFENGKNYNMTILLWYLKRGLEL